jgi:hypothetical protein
MKKSKSGSAGMKGKDMFNASRTTKKGFIPKPSKFGGTKNSTDIRTQPK